METLIDVLHYIVRNRFFVLLGVVVGLFVIRFAVYHFVQSKSIKTKIDVSIAAFLWGFLMLFFFGPDWVNKQIYQYGELGEGMIVDRRRTGDLYNEEPVIRYRVLLKTKTGKTLETSFQNNHFNLYPEPNYFYTYPTDGTEFNIKYLKKNPDTFVILTDDKSVYARKQKCAQRLNDLNAAKNKYGFDSDNASYKKNYLRAIDAYIEAECVENPEIKDFYDQERSKLK